MQYIQYEMGSSHFSWLKWGSYVKQWIFLEAVCVDAFFAEMKLIWVLHYKAIL